MCCVSPDAVDHILKSAYKTYAWGFLKDYKGSFFTGEWPTLVEMFKITVHRYSERACFTIYDPERVSLNYSEALAQIEAVARALHAAGVRKGDRVAVTGKNVPEWTVAYLGILFAGGIVVPIDYQLRTDEQERILAKAKAKMLFVDEEKHPHFCENAAALSLEKVYSLKKGIGTYIYDLNGPTTDGIELPLEGDLAAIMFTSGTTGIPKGVMLTHQNLVSDCYLAQGLLDVLHTDVFYALLPLHHAYTMLAVFMETISTGGEVVFGKKMVVANILKDLKQAKVTMFLGVPMLFNKLLAAILKGIKAKGAVVWVLMNGLMYLSGAIKKLTGKNIGKKLFGAVLRQASLETIRICISGGGPLAPSVFRKWNQLGIDFIQGYGLTETSPIINLNPVERYKETSVGKVLPKTQMKIQNPDERGVGEVLVKGPMVMKGYFEMPEDTAAVFTEDGFLKTGDLGYLDDENYLYLTGRAKNMIVTNGGKNVYPEEIENEFQLFDEIDQILVRGFIEGKNASDERIEALVYPEQSWAANLDAAAVKERIEAIVSEVNTRLLPYQKIERTVILTEAMEMTTTKKIKR